MTRQTARRDKWHRTMKGTWTCSLGTRGARVRLFQKRIDGVFYREIHLRGEGRDQVTLNTHSRATAEEFGRSLLGRLMLGVSTRSNGPVRLGELWDRYRIECPYYLDNSPHSKQDAAIRAAILVGYFGADYDMRSLTGEKVLLYEQTRVAGGIKYVVRGVSKLTKRARQRSSAADLMLLRAMLRWACTVRTSDGGVWLLRNPLQGVPIQVELNPLRPVATSERFAQLRAAIQERAASALTEALRIRWTRLELALVIAGATGRRRGSIVALRWEDIDLGGATIHWRAESDKTGVGGQIPIPGTLVAELRAFRNALGDAAGWLFPRAAGANGHIPAAMLGEWLARVEKDANIPKLMGGLWHVWRRKWATDRMHLPLKAVADTGGWKDTDTLIECYQQTPDRMMMEVMECAPYCKAQPVMFEAVRPVAVDDAGRAVHGAAETAHKLHQAL